MARQRDYRAEYAARQARSRERYGVSYGQQRRAVEQAKAKGVPASEFRSKLAQTRSVKLTRAMSRAYPRARDGGDGIPSAILDTIADLDIPIWWLYE